MKKVTKARTPKPKRGNLVPNAVRGAVPVRSRKPKIGKTSLPKAPGAPKAPKAPKAPVAPPAPAIPSPDFGDMNSPLPAAPMRPIM